MDNKYSVYRQIRFNRTYRTLGKVTWWRVALGILLIVAVLLISGVVSQSLASRGKFSMAEKLMVYPQWMEKYKPETKAFIEAGVSYENGDFEAASTAFGAISDFDAAVVMKSASDLRIASENIDAENMLDAYSDICSVDFTLLSEEDSALYIQHCELLHEHFSALSNKESSEISDNLNKLMAAADKE